MITLGEAYRNVEASTNNDFEKLPPGGYVCAIKSVTNHHEGDKPFLEIVYDIREGKYADYYADEWGQENLWAHTNRHYYSEAALGMFKGFLKAVDISNNTDFEAQAEFGFDEQRLIGKTIGYILGEEEYRGNDGSIKTRLRVRRTVTSQQVREGKYKFPETKKLEEAAPQIQPTPEISESDLPF